MTQYTKVGKNLVYSFTTGVTTSNRQKELSQEDEKIIELVERLGPGSAFDYLIEKKDDKRAAAWILANYC